MSRYTCLCGSEKYTPVPDEEVDSLPPSLTARQFHCENCGGTDWCEAEDFGLEDWED